MRYLRFAPLDRNVSRLVLGTASLPDLGEAASFELLDEWRRLGGNALDTAQHYRRSESIIGRWLEARGCRNEIVLVTKGGHPADGRPRLTPEDLADDVEGSLDRLGVEAIDLYLGQYRCLFDSEKLLTLFLTSKGTPIDRIAVWKMVKERAKRAGIQKNISPHTLRHSFATHLLDNGADLRVIQEMMGHASINSTDRYMHISSAHLQEAFTAFHPRG